MTGKPLVPQPSSAGRPAPGRREAAAGGYQQPTLPAAGGWCASARHDPITGLVAYPDFDEEFPALLWQSLQDGHTVGLAVGDVDHLKEYVEAANAADPMSFGHLAGNALMRQLGEITATWFYTQKFPSACASTFGGDEIILVARTKGLPAFHDTVACLARILASRLPRTVSFALATLSQADVPPVVPGPGWARHLYVHLISAVDRCLFAAKATREGDATDGSVTIAALPPIPQQRRSTA
jgi:GGDEF domain-containing protein